MRFAWISHRGESMDAPENTLSAFRLSSARDVDGMECDIHFTLDREVVCAHDPHTERTSEGAVHAVIAETRFADLEKINVRHGFRTVASERIPKFSEALKTLARRRTFFVEIKVNDPELLKAMKRIVDESGTPHEQIVVISFHQDMIRESRTVMPDIRTLWLTGFEEKEDGTFHPDAEELIAILRNLKADGVDAHCNPKVVTAEYVKKVKDAGFYFAVWTVDDEKEAEHFMKIGVDSITSNRAGELCERLGRN